tara:strand:- start:2723 stop:3253 length:531 start_codon:yes stop_codon:yes gene_type:complete
MLIYNPDIYHRNTNNSCRYALGISGKNPLFVVGLNPSTADDQKPDQTIKKVMGFAQRNGFDGFVMLNLYPKRTPYPDRLHKRFNKSIFQENLARIKALLQSHQQVTILAAWGEIINVRKYMKQCLTDLIDVSQDLDANWVVIGDLTKSGHPRHPSRAPYNKKFQRFDVSSYSKKLK